MNQVNSPRLDDAKPAGTDPRDLQNPEDQMKKEMTACDYLLVGIGEEWRRSRDAGVKKGYEALHQMLHNKNYFIVTTVTDADIFRSSLDSERIVAPCGNETWRQCSEACRKDIWERKAVKGCVCPYCGSILVGNTIRAKTYVEDGYLPQWDLYQDWLSRTQNHNLLILELGVGFKTPTVIRWPFEKTVFFNQKAHMYRINGTLSQISEGISDRATGISENSVKFILRCRDM